MSNTWVPSAGTGALTDNNPNGPNPAVPQPGTIPTQLVLPTSQNIPQPAYTNQPVVGAALAQPPSPGVDAFVGNVHVRNPA